MTPLLVGVLLALGVGVFATAIGLDRERAFYTTVMLVIAFLYCLFAAIGASTHTLVLEALAGTAFAVVTVAGFRSAFWLVAVALAGHGVFDFVHGAIIPNPGVPAWWPGFCGGYDVAAGAYLAWLIARGRVR